MTRTETATARLQSLRKKLTALSGCLAAFGLATLAITTILVDGRLRDDRFGVQQQGFASRAAALVFEDEIGAWNTDGVVDDMVFSEVEILVVIEQGTNEVLLRRGPVADLASIATAAFNDAAEEGVTSELMIDGRLLQAAAAPYFSGPTVHGAVVVASPPFSDPDHDRLVLFVWLTALGLTALSVAGAWLISGRLLRPMGEAIDREAAFLTTAAHELRTPLSRAQASAEATFLTARDLAPSDQRTALLSELRQLVGVTRSASADVNDLLLIGRVEADQLAIRRERVRLDLLVAAFEDIVPELAVATSEAIEIVADPVLVKHAIANLFTNAQRHARQSSAPLLIEATVERQGQAAVVTVSDNGPGLPDTDTDRLFERHYSSDAGSGLGLVIVKHLVQAHDGTVQVRNRSASSNRPTGAVFEIRIPLAP